jgi:hypothetical protein
MKVTSPMDTHKDKALKLILMVITKVSSIPVKNKDMEYMNGMMVIVIKATF